MCAPFPRGYTVSRGVPGNCTFEIALSLAAMLTLMLVCSFSPRKYKSILRGFYNAVSLPGDCHATLAMTKSALHGKTQAFASNRRTPTLRLGSMPLETDSFNSGTGEFTRKVERQRVAVQGDSPRKFICAEDVDGQKNNAIV